MMRIRKKNTISFEFITNITTWSFTNYFIQSEYIQLQTTGPIISTSHNNSILMSCALPYRHRRVKFNTLKHHLSLKARSALVATQFRRVDIYVATAFSRWKTPIILYEWPGFTSSDDGLGMIRSESFCFDAPYWLTKAVSEALTMIDVKSEPINSRNLVAMFMCSNLKRKL